MNIKQVLVAASHQLRAKSETADVDAALLLAFVLQQPRSYLYAWPERKLTLQEYEQFQQLVKRRAAGEPVAYLTGTKEFWSLELSVTPDTLIPRPETELMVETVLGMFNETEALVLADLGTGSGAIALALASEKPHWEIHATDQSVNALAVAALNAKKLTIKNVNFHLGSWCDALPDKYFNVIVSNPPYLSHAEWPQYAKGLRYEPASALLAPDAGLADLKAIIEDAKKHLSAHGFLFLEHGFEQGAAVRNLFELYGYSNVKTVLDLAKNERLTYGRS